MLLGCLWHSVTPGTAHSWMAGPFICSPVVTKAPGEGPRERPQIGATAGLGRLRAELYFKEVLIANSTSPCLPASLSYMMLKKGLELLMSSLDAVACALEKSRNGYLFTVSLGGQMRKSTINILRCIDKTAICVYDLSDYVLLTITAGQDVAGGEAEVKSHYMQGSISAFLCSENNQGLCYFTLTVSLPLFFKNNDYTSKDCLACILGIMAQRSANKYMAFIRRSTDAMHSKFTGI